jgi:hypothetical protein
VTGFQECGRERSGGWSADTFQLEKREKKGVRSPSSRWSKERGPDDAGAMRGGPGGWQRWWGSDQSGREPRADGHRSGGVRLGR